MGMWNGVVTNSQDVDHVQFTTTRFRIGYNEDEVDQCLDSVVAQLKAYEQFMARYVPVMMTIMEVAEPAQQEEFKRYLRQTGVYGALRKQ